MYDHKWRYKVETFKPGSARDLAARDEIIQDKLNRYGSDGWEVFHYAPMGAHVQVLLKRKH